MKKLLPEEKASIFYHSFFDYPLTEEDLLKWAVGRKFLSLFPKKINVIQKDGFYFLPEEKSSISWRQKREKFSERKIKIAKKAASLISLLPTVKLVAITGSLAMRNADIDSDIDLMIVTKSGFLWTTRIFVYLFLFAFGFPFRRFGSREVKDKLCLNIWLDEGKLVWHKKNIFTAHEVLQIVPLLNRNFTYEQFLSANLWAFDYWPNAADKRKLKWTAFLKLKIDFFSYIWAPFELLAFLLQRLYMLGKIGRETVSLDRAIFHPIDLSDRILQKLHT